MALDSLKLLTWGLSVSDKWPRSASIRFLEIHKYSRHACRHEARGARYSESWSTPASAGRLADATICPLRVWDEAVAVVAESPHPSGEEDKDAALVWVLEEAEGMCEMF